MAYVLLLIGKLIATRRVQPLIRVHIINLRVIGGGAKPPCFKVIIVCLLQRSVEGKSLFVASRSKKVCEFLPSAWCRLTFFK